MNTLQIAKKEVIAVVDYLGNEIFIPNSMLDRKVNAFKTKAKFLIKAGLISEMDSVSFDEEFTSNRKFFRISVYTKGLHMLEITPDSLDGFKIENFMDGTVTTGKWSEIKKELS